jgi:hypothetical protein
MKLIQFYIVFLILFTWPVMQGNAAAVGQDRYDAILPPNDDSLVHIGTFQFGLTGIFGKVISTSNDLPAGSTRYRNGGGAGFYISYPLSERFYIYQNASITRRGFNIDYTKNQSIVSTKSQEVIHSGGYLNLLYFDKVTCIGVNVSKSFSAFAGLATTIRLKAKFHYNSSVTVTDSLHHTTIYNYPPYYQTGNNAIDLADLALVAGIRWYAFNTVGFSVRYMRDVAALNLSSENMFRNTYVNSGFYFAIDIPLYKNKFFEVFQKEGLVR